MAKRKKGMTFIPYDYEAAYNKSLEDMHEFFVEQMFKQAFLQSIRECKAETVILFEHMKKALASLKEDAEAAGEGYKYDALEAVYIKGNLNLCVMTHTTHLRSCQTLRHWDSILWQLHRQQRNSMTQQLISDWR